MGHRKVTISIRLVPGPSRLADSIRQRLKVITRRFQCVRIGGNAHNLPASRSRHAFTMHLAQVIAMGFRIRGERTEDGS